MALAKSNLTFNVISNYAGTMWAALVQVVLIPVYIRLLGVESYGLVGFFVTLQAVLQVLDFGISPALNREMARRTALDPVSQDTRDVLKTVEYVSWGTGAVIGLAIVAASTFLATRWIHVETLAQANVRTAILFMGCALAAQWPTNSYTGALMGLQRQVMVNVLKVLASTVSGLGAIAVLTLISPTIVAFFVWRACVSLVEVLVIRHVLWRSTPPDGGLARFRLTALQGMWRFSLGMAAISLTVVILMHVDKVVLSAVLPMEYFGFYMVATSVANFLPQLVSPVFSAVFPSLSKLVAAGEFKFQKQQFHLSAQFVSVVVYPPAVSFMLFSHTIIDLWTRNDRLATYSGPVLAVLAVGAVVNSMMVVPYILQLAHGWTRLTIVMNVVLISLSVPYTVFAVRHFGIVGAASTWALLNTLAVLVGAPLIFRRLLPGEGWRWLLRDVALPGAAVFGAAGLVWLLMPRQGPPLLMATKLLIAILLSYAAALTTAGGVRRRVPVTLAALGFQPAIRSSTP